MYWHARKYKYHPTLTSFHIQHSRLPLLSYYQNLHHITSHTQALYNNYSFPHSHSLPTPYKFPSVSPSTPRLLQELPADHFTHTAQLTTAHSPALPLSSLPPAHASPPFPPPGTSPLSLSQPRSRSPQRSLSLYRSRKPPPPAQWYYYIHICDTQDLTYSWSVCVCIYLIVIYGKGVTITLFRLCECVYYNPI